MHPISLIFGLACAGCFASAAHVRSGSAQIMALMMTIVWAAANMLALLEMIEALALVDLPVACLGFALWHVTRRVDHAAFSVLFGMRLPLHVLDAADLMDRVSYIHTVNALFLAALIAIGWRGLRDAVGSAVRRWGVYRLRLFLAFDRGDDLPAERSR